MFSSEPREEFGDAGVALFIRVSTQVLVRIKGWQHGHKALELNISLMLCGCLYCILYLQRLYECVSLFLIYYLETPAVKLKRNLWQIFQFPACIFSPVSDYKRETYTNRKGWGGRCRA